MTKRNRGWDMGGESATTSVFFSGVFYLIATKQCRGEVSTYCQITGEGDTLRGEGGEGAQSEPNERERRRQSKT